MTNIIEEIHPSIDKLERAKAGVEAIEAAGRDPSIAVEARMDLYARASRAASDLLLRLKDEGPLRDLSAKIGFSDAEPTEAE